MQLGDAPAVENKRIKPCKSCRRKRVACDREPHSDESCGRCLARGLTCEFEEPVGGATREENSQAAMRAQIKRLEHVLALLEKKTGLVPAATADQEDIAVDDLVASMQNMLFAADGLDGSPDDEVTRDEILVEAQNVLSEPSFRADPHAGFVLDAAPAAELSLQALIGKLPDWPTAKHLITEVFPKLWVFFRIATYAPDFPLRVEALYRSSFTPLPPPAVVADIFAVLCLTMGTLATKHGQDTVAYRRAQTESNHFTACASRALALADYVNSPTIMSIRALHTMAVAFIGAARETANFRRALALLPLAVSMVYRLNLHTKQNDDASIVHETAMQTFERRQLINALSRDDAFFTLLWTKHAFSDPDNITCPPPTPLRDEDLPASLRDSPFRVTQVTLHNFYCRSLMGPIRREVCKKLWLSKKVNYAEVKRMSAAVDDIEKLFYPEWEIKTGQPLVPIDNLEMRAGRFATPPGLAQLRVQLHRAFIAYRKPPPGLSAQDIAWHRDKVLDGTQALLSIALDMEEDSGLFVALSYGCLDAAIATCLIVSLDPDHPKNARVRDVVAAYVEKAHADQTPSLIKRLTRLMLYLLDRPKVRRASLTDAETGAKKGRYGLTELAGPRSGESQSNSTQNEGYQFALPDFAATLLGPDDERRRRTPGLTSDNNSMASGNSPSTLGEINVNDTLDLLEQLEKATGPSWATFDFGMSNGSETSVE